MDKTLTPDYNPNGSKWQIVSLMILVFHIIMIAYYYPGLPESIPKHFGPNGLPDAWGKKTSLLLLPVIGLFTFGIFYAVSQIKKGMNMPVKLTPENKERQFRLYYDFIQQMDLLTQFLFFYISYQTIQIALEKAKSLGPYTMIIVLVVAFGLPIYYFIRASSLK